MSCAIEKKYKGIRRRKWGKWVSEIRVPGTQERLWLGTYATPEAAAMARDVAFYCLRRPSSLDKLNFPDMLPSYCVHHRHMLPSSVQKVASDAAMAVDAQTVHAGNLETAYKREDHDGFWWEGEDDDWEAWQWQASEDYKQGEALTISIEDYL